ncbi:MAG: class I SAM-dependent methyltransferase [Candidatus Binatia bacterium]
MRRSTDRAADGLHGVAESCLFTLNARACESRRADALFHDPVAERIVARLALDTSRYDRDWLTQTGVAIRTEILDHAVRDFVAKYPRAVVVNLGAGLCTRFFRIDDGTLDWVDIDDPAVIELRQRLIDTPARCHLLTASILRDEWRTDVLRLATGRPLLFIAEGVLQYFEPPEVQRLLTSLAENFPEAEALVEAISPLAMAASRWQPSLRAVGVRARWGIGRASTIEDWSPRIRVVDAIFYDRHLVRWRWLRRFHWVPAVRKLMQIVHLRFAPHSRSAGATSS